MFFKQLGVGALSNQLQTSPNIIIDIATAIIAISNLVGLGSVPLALSLPLFIYKKGFTPLQLNPCNNTHVFNVYNE